MGMPGMRLSYKFKREQTPSITNLSWHFCPCCFLALLIYRSLPTLAGPIGGGKKLAEYYGRAYGMDTAEFAKNRLLEDFPYNRVKVAPWLWVHGSVYSTAFFVCKHVCNVACAPTNL
eukprot:scaffold37765_cov19-Tisochrysis_lutea.AAC.1